MNRKASVVAVATKTDNLAGFVRGIGGGLVNAAGAMIPVNVSCPSWSEYTRQGFPGEATGNERAKARCFLEALKAVKRLHAIAAREHRDMAGLAKEEAGRHRAAIENAWVALWAQNRKTERRVRQVWGLFANLDTGRAAFARRLHFFGISMVEAASQQGAEHLKHYLSHWADRPDPRDARSFVLVPGWVGSAKALHRLVETVHEARAVLVSDAPEFSSLDALKQASEPGGCLEELPGRDVCFRHAVLHGNSVRARRAFQGAFASEEADLFIDASPLHFGGYLKNIAKGVPWKPKVGAQHPLEGADGVRVDLVLGRDAAGLLSRHRINPAVLAAADSERVLVWGPDTLYNKGRGAQIGVAVVETLLARYTEFVINKYGLLEDLADGRRIVEGKLAAFLAMNSGADRMFLMPSRVRVSVDHETRKLLVDFKLRFREVAERATIRLTAALPTDDSRVSTRLEAPDED